MTTEIVAGHDGISISDFPSVRERAEALSCAFPDGLALLPSNFLAAEVRSDLKESSEAATLRKLFRTAGLEITPLLPIGEKSAISLNRSAGWIGPAIFISAGLLSTNATAVSVALGVLTNYLSDFMKGSLRSKGVELDVIVERHGDRVCKRISYNGPIEGLAQLADAVVRVANE